MNHPTVETIRDLQDQVNAALLGGDWETLHRLVAERALVIGPKGFMIRRDEWIGVHQEGAYEQRRLATSDTHVEVYDGAGVRVDTVDSECLYHGESITGTFRVCQTWALDGGEWRLAAVQYTGTPPQAGA
jgi:hypothetical protein